MLADGHYARFRSVTQSMACHFHTETLMTRITYKAIFDSNVSQAEGRPTAEFDAGMASAILGFRHLNLQIRDLAYLGYTPVERREVAS